MSTLDSYEYLRGPVRRRRARAAKATRPPKPKETQIPLRLRGGMTAKEREVGEPFNDEIPF